MSWFGKKAQPPSPEKPSSDQVQAWVNGAIDTFMTHVCGYKDPSSRTDEYGRRHFSKGSANGIAWSQVDEDGDVFFHCAAYVMDLPAEKDLLLPFYRELLDINWEITGGQRLATRDSGLWMTFSEAASMLDPQEIALAIHRVMDMADRLDNHLIGKYGGTLVARERPR